MPFAIWITGLPGSGKSTIAKELAKKIDAKILRLDEFRSKLVSNPRFTDEERTLGVIYLVRDPRDIVISYAHHMNKKIDEVVDSIAKKD